MNIAESSFHDSILVDARIEPDDNLTLLFRGCTPTDCVAPSDTVDVALIAHSVSTVAVLTGPPDTDSGRGLLRSRDFHEWQKQLVDDAIDVLSLAISVGTDDDPFTLEVYGATNDQFRLRVSCRQVCVCVGSDVTAKPWSLSLKEK